MPSSFRLNGVDFPITRAHLEAFFSGEDDPAEECLVWHLALAAKGQAPVIEGERGRDWMLGLQSDPGELLHTKPGELVSWLDLAGREGGWTEREDADGEPHALFDLFECEPIYDCRWSLQAHEDRLRLHLKAKVDPHVGEGWMEGLQLEVDTPLELAEIPCGRETERSCRAQLKRFGLKDELEFHKEQGVSRLRLVQNAIARR